MRRSALILIVILTLVCAVPRSAMAAPVIVASNGDASVSHDTTAGTWLVSAGGTTLTLNADAARDFATTRLATATGQSWTAVTQADSVVTVGGQTVALGSRSAGFTYVEGLVQQSGNGLELQLYFERPASGLQVTRHYAIVPGSPTFETWNSYIARNGSVTLADLNALQLVVPSGTLHWVTGLNGDNADSSSGSPFTLLQQNLASGDRLSIGAAGRSSEKVVPWIEIDGNTSASAEELYVALMWSGAWSLTAQGSGSNIALSIGLAPMSTTVTTTVDGPHVLFGVAQGGMPQAAASMRSYLINGVRGGRDLSPLVTYNTWFAYGTDIDEASMENEMDSAAQLGTELFVIDAGWYTGAGATDPFDFDSGLGSWQADPTRFPNGLRPLRDYAHSLGMKFGFWVEPERINQALVGSSGLDEKWLATTGGNYGSADAGQVCLANKAAQQWLLSWLTGLLDSVQPDYLKWDNNMWINCDRPGHEHGASDGNFAHVNGLYQVLATLRQQYPDLLIENVSGGGNRMDAGMFRYTDAAWMDDRTAPSSLVRHNVEGLGQVFPPAYLLSFLTDHDTEPLHDAPDMSLYTRSRMAGALGLCFKSSELGEGDTSSLSREISIYKAIRDTLQTASGSLLTAQVPTDTTSEWDVLQESASDSDQVLVCAYQGADAPGKVNIKPTGLDPAGTYDVQSVDTGDLGTALGSDLMSGGIDVQQSPNTAAHILTLKKQKP